MKTKTKIKTFYHHLISVDKIYSQISLIKLDPKQKKEITILVHETIHTKILDVILDKLPSSKHHHFLEKFSQDPGNKELAKFLKKHNKDIEKHIKKTYQEIEEELLAELSGNSK